MSTQASTHEGILGLAARSLLPLLPRGRKTAFDVIWRLVGSPPAFVARVDGSPFVVDVYDRHTALQTCLQGIFEDDVSCVFVSLLSRGSVVLDIGANKGYFSLLAANRVGNEGKVISYEALPRNSSDIAKTIELGRHRCWEVVPYAVSSNEGVVRFADSDFASGHSGWGHVDAKGSLEVKSVTIDAEIERRNLDVVDLVKMDIEGHELHAFAGMRRAFETGKIRNLIVELHLAVLDLSEVNSHVAALKAQGYTPYLIEGDISRAKAVSFLRGRSSPDPIKSLLRPLGSIASGQRIHVLFKRACQ